MQYFQKNNSIYYQLDSTTFTYVELFSLSTQKRIMKITDQKIYNDTVTRINNSQFEVSDEQTFNEVKSNIITLLS